MSSNKNDVVDGSKMNHGNNDNLNESQSKNVIKTQSLEEIDGIKKLNWAIDLVCHSRYKDQEEVYKLKDNKLLELAWRNLNNHKGIINVGCIVVPVVETSTSIQKKYRKIVWANASDWEFRRDKIIDASVEGQYNQYWANTVPRTFELAESIKRFLPKFDGKIVLDVAR